MDAARIDLRPLAPIPPTGSPGTAGPRTTSLESAAPLLVLEKTRVTKYCVSATAATLSRLRAHPCPETSCRERRRRYREDVPWDFFGRQLTQNLAIATHLDRMTEIASSTSFTGTTSNTGPKISLRMPTSVGDSHDKHRAGYSANTYSLIKESSIVTLSTMVGATYRVATST